jgi:hypothetical protein
LNKGSKDKELKDGFKEGLESDFNKDLKDINKGLNERLDNDSKEGFKEGATFKGLSNIINIVYKDFFLKVGVKAEAGVGIGIGVIEIKTIKFDYKEGFNNITFKGLSNIISRIEDFFSEAGTKAGIETAIGVFKTVKIVGIFKIVRVIIKAVEIGAAGDIGLKASSSYARHSKIVL